MTTAPDRAMPNAFGALLRRYRRAAGLTQEALAERAAYSAVYVGMLHSAATWSRPRSDTGESAPPLVGRAEELARLDRHLAGEGPPLLLLAGEPGIGKTSLLREAAQGAAGQGWSVVAGGCRRHDQEPYAPLPEALAASIRSHPVEQTRSDLRGCAWLVRLLPELAQHLEPGDEPLAVGELPAAQERRLMFGAVARYLANVAGPAGTLLVLDDLQWAEVDALDLLTSLLSSASTAAAPLRVVGAYRETEIEPTDALAIALADLAHAGLATRLRLAGLTPEETGELFDRLATSAPGDRAELRARVVQQADGVPFYLVSWAQGVRAAGNGASVDDVPWDIAQSVRQRVAALPAPARAILPSAALIGRTVPPPLLAAVSARPEAELIEALSALDAAGLLVEREGVYHFAHDVIREVVERDAGAARRIAIHRRIAEALEGMPGEPPVEVLAHHFDQARESEKAAHYLVLAGDRAAAWVAFAAAEEHYQASIERLDALGRVDVAAQVREKLGMTLAQAGRYDAALVVFDAAADAYRAAEEREGVARVLTGIGYIHGWRGTPQVGLARIQPLLDAFDGAPPSPGVVLLHMALGQLCMHSGRAAESLAAIERAAELAGALAEARLVALTEMGRGHLLRMVGRVEEAIPIIEEAVGRAEAVDNRTILISALDSLLSVRSAAGDFASAKRLCQRALALAERSGNPLHIAAMTSLRGWLAFFTGDWPAARVDLEAAATFNRELDAGWLCPWMLGRLCLAEGNRAAGVEYLNACVATGECSGDVHTLRLAHQSLAELDLLDGRPAEAKARLLPLLDRPGLEEWQVTELLPTLAWGHLELGEPAEAADVAARAVARSRQQQNRLALVEALRVEGLVAMCQERCDVATAALTESLSLARELGYPFGEARALFAAGLVADRRGAPETAREAFTSALAICRRLGARGEAERIEWALTGLPGP